MQNFESNKFENDLIPAFINQGQESIPEVKMPQGFATQTFPSVAEETLSNENFGQFI